jgi:hypothetical protein
VVNILINILMDTQLNCCICLDDSNESDTQNFIKLNCNHIFHRKCMLINEYISCKKLCPLCRKNYTMDLRHPDIIKSEIQYYNIINISKKYMNIYYNIPIDYL